MASTPDQFQTLANEIAKLVASKQAAYGDSFGKSGEVLRILYPYGIEPEQYGDMLTVTRVLDKLFRVATDRDAFGESPWRDVMGYALLATARTAPAAAAPEPVRPACFLCNKSPATHSCLSGRLSTCQKCSGPCCEPFDSVTHD